jgi:hypothetical protein
VHGFWPVEFSEGRLGASHYCCDSVMFGLVSSLRLRKYSWPHKWRSTQINTHPSPTQHTQQARPPAPLTPPRSNGLYKKLNVNNSFHRPQRLRKSAYSCSCIQ